MPLLWISRSTPSSDNPREGDMRNMKTSRLGMRVTHPDRNHTWILIKKLPASRDDQRFVKGHLYVCVYIYIYIYIFFIVFNLHIIQSTNLKCTAQWVFLCMYTLHCNHYPNQDGEHFRALWGLLFSVPHPVNKPSQRFILASFTIG